MGTALVLGANGVQADETLPVNPATSDIAATNKKDADSALTTPVVEELPELKIDDVKAEEKPEAKEDAKTAATPVAEKEVSDKSDKEASKENRIKNKLTKRSN